MNKAKKGALGAAGVGVVALAMFGGGTFALWSDFDTIEDNEAQAGALTLYVDDEGTTTTPVGPLAPGENKTVYRYIASRSDDTAALQDAQLFLRIEDIVGQDDGCTSNTEKADEQAHGYTQYCGYAGGGPYTQAGTGHFADQAWLQVRAAAVDTPTQCASGVRTTPVGAARSLANWQNVKYDTLRELDPGQGVCIAFELGLPSNVVLSGDSNDGIDFAGASEADNAVQGDSATFDVTFLLEQQIPNVD